MIPFACLGPAERLDPRVLHRAGPDERTYALHGQQQVGSGAFTSRVCGCTACAAQTLLAEAADLRTARSYASLRKLNAEARSIRSSPPSPPPDFTEVDRLVAALTAHLSALAASSGEFAARSAADWVSSLMPANSTPLLCLCRDGIARWLTPSDLRPIRAALRRIVG